MDKLMQFLSEDNGGPSSGRLVMFLVAVSAIIDWQHAVWTKGVWTPNYEVVIILLSTMGLKVIQKKFEKNPLPGGEKGVGNTTAENAEKNQ